MRARLWPVLLAAAALFAAQAATADPVGRYFYVTPMGGLTIFPSNYQWPANHTLADKLYVGGRLGYQRGQLWALELAGGVTPTNEDVAGGRNVSFTHASANVVMTPWASRIGGPYFFVGGGAGRLSTTGSTPPSNDKTKTNLELLEGGGGVKLWLTDVLGL